jgi:hypothetical protein
MGPLLQMGELRTAKREREEKTDKPSGAHRALLRGPFPDLYLLLYRVR